MADLFDEAAGRRLETVAPLAQRLRPADARRASSARSTWSGRAARCGSRSRPTACRRSSSTARPGSGKTTLARIVAQHDRRRVRGALGRLGDGRERARGARRARASGSGASGRRTILFLDEIHRFNKAQQDALLPGRRGGARDADRRDDREPVLRAQLGAALADAGLRARAARPRSELREVVRRGAGELGVELVAGGRGADRARAPAATRGPRSAILELAVADRRRRGRRSTRAPRRGRGAQAAAPLRQGRRRATTTRSRPGSSRRARATCRRRSTTSR